MKIVVLLLSFICMSGCGKSDKLNQTSNKLNQTSIQMKKKTYYLYYTLRGNYEVFCNGISLSEYTDQDGAATASEYLNPLISGKGIQTVSIKINSSDGNVLSPEYLKGVKISLYFSENGDEGDLVLVKDFTLKPYNENQSMVFETWSFNADVDYENENPLHSASDLAKEDIHKLSEDVLNKYNEVLSIINSGDANKYSEIYKDSFKREITSMYLDANETQKYINNLKSRVIASKGFMKPIEGYKININPNNKIVELTSSKGKPVLYSIDDKRKIKFFSLQLYRSSKTGKLEVY